MRIVRYDTQLRMKRGVRSFCSRLTFLVLLLLVPGVGSRVFAKDVIRVTEEQSSPWSEVPSVIPPFELTQKQLEESSEEELLELAEIWWEEYGDQVRVQLRGRRNIYERSRPSRPKSELQVSLMMRVVRFSREFAGEQLRNARIGDFNAQYANQVAGAPPGVAWAVFALSKDFRVRNVRGFNRTGMAGIRIPLVGSQDILLKNNEGRLTFAFLPIGGSIEKVYYYDQVDLSRRFTDPRGGLTPRFGAALEGAYRLGGEPLGGRGLQPGARFLAMPKLLRPDEVRMVAEVYFKIDMTRTRRKNIYRAAIVPRCIYEYNIARHGDAAIRAGFDPEIYDFVDHNLLCLVNAEVAFGF